MRDRRLKNSISCAAVVLLLLTLLTTFTSSCKRTASESDKPRLIVSIPPQEYLLRRIVGNRFEVSTLMQTNADPENFEPSMANLMALQKANTYFTVGGLDFEATTAERLKENFPSLEVVVTRTGIAPIKGTHASGSGFDPHVWTSPRNAMIMAKNMYDKVVALDPSGKDFYSKRLSELNNQLAEYDDSIKNILHNSGDAIFVVIHPSLSYFARDYGLRQISIEEDGKESTPRILKQRIDQALGKRPATLFAQKGGDGRQAEMTAGEMHIPVTEININSADWLDQLIVIANAIASERNN